MSVPKLRFLEFQDALEWESRKLGDIAPLQRGFDLPSDQIQAGSIPVVYSNGVQKFHSKGMAKGPGLVTGRSGTIGKINFIKEGDYWAHNTTLWVTSFKGNIPKFVYYLYKFIGTTRFASGSGVPTLNRNDVHAFQTYLPTSLLEQQKIADCLTSLESVITAQSQKLEALGVHKRGLMQQLFPSEGETVPKLRFLEFQDAGDWEEKKLATVAVLTSSKRVHLSDYVPVGIPFFRGKEISLLRNNQTLEDILYISEDQYEEIKENFGVPEIGDILITAVGTLGNVYCVKNLNKFYFKDGNLIWMKKISENSMFLEILLNVKSEDVLSSAIGSSQKALTIAGLNKLSFAFPEKVEQQKIADCLTALEQLITAQKQKLELLKSHKKGLMQQLFPAPDEAQT